jgi:integrase
MGTLTALAVKNAKPGDKLGDGDGLRLDVDKNGNASWLFRFTSPTEVYEKGKNKGDPQERFMGLGPLRDVGLAQARELAGAARALIRNNIDPIEHRIAERAKAKADATGAITFKVYSERFITGREAGWKNEKHRQQWRNSLRDYAYPYIGDLAVADVDTEAVLNVLRPIWNQKKETARRVRGRIEAILNAAKVEGLRTGENPALWRGHLDQVGLARRRKSDVKHHAALPYAELPTFMASLATDTSNAAAMLRFIIATVCRYNEANEMDHQSEVKDNVWTIPAIRMKAERPHAVPLTGAAMACFPVPRVSDVALSSCIKRHTSTPATCHGFRSTFRDWCGDCTEYPRELAEAALAHVLKDDTEAAYRRSTALAKRRALMNAWADYCASANIHLHRSVA